MLNIKGLSLGNFRVFADMTNIRLAPLTILAGPNSSGKSTFAGSLSVMKNLDTSHLPYRVRFDRGKDPAGSFDMIRNYSSHDERVNVGYDLHSIILGEDVHVSFTLQRGSDFDALIRRISVSNADGNIFELGFEKDNFSVNIRARHLLNRMREIKRARKKFVDLERSFREIRSSSGCYKETPAKGNNKTRVRIFHIDNGLKRKNIIEHLKNRNISEEEYERLFYFFGRQRVINGNVTAEDDLTRKAAAVMEDCSEEEILFNNELLKKILSIPGNEVTESALLSVIKNDFPELYDCLALLANPSLLEKITGLLRSRSYGEWEADFVECELTSSKRIAGSVISSDLQRIIDHHFQARFDKSVFLQSLTELSMAREGFLQVYDRYRNLKSLSMFCSLVLEKIIHDIRNDLDRSVAVQLNDATPGLTIGFDHPLHGLIRDYAKISRKDTFLKKWIRKFNICDDFSPDAPMKGMGYFPGIRRNNENYPLSGEGSGTSRLMIMLLSISNTHCICDLRDFNDEPRQYPETIYLEEPETGLHPSWQSKLADMIADAKNEKGLHFIIETHSDNIINKIRYLVASGQLSPNDVVIQYFDNSRNGSPVSTEIVICENGELSREIPSGFADEDDFKTMGLFGLKKFGRN
jgi:AAA15 family ATPase/GTPase